MRGNANRTVNWGSPPQRRSCVFELCEAQRKWVSAQLEPFTPPTNNGINLTALGPVMSLAYAIATPGYPQCLHFPVQTLRPTPQVIPALYGLNEGQIGN